MFIFRDANFAKQLINVHPPRECTWHEVNPEDMDETMGDRPVTLFPHPEHGNVFLRRKVRESNGSSYWLAEDATGIVVAMVRFADHWSSDIPGITQCVVRGSLWYVDRHGCSFRYGGRISELAAWIEIEKCTWG